MEGKEERIRAITYLYYSNPKVQEALVEFGRNREVVPRYFEGFGKRPDSIQYASDIMGLVSKGATSFHCSEEIWNDPLQINSEMTPAEFNNVRKGWDLLIDIDSPFLDCSKIAAQLIIAALEHHGIKNYGIKFSGSKGFHLIVSSAAFPEEYEGKLTREMFPEWPRAISEYLMDYIRSDYYRKIGSIVTAEEVAKRTNIKAKDLEAVYCTKSNHPAKLGALVKLRCDTCGLEIERRDVKLTKRKLRCLNNNCSGFLEVMDTKEYYFCEYCKDPENEKVALSSDKYPEIFNKMVGINADSIAKLDLVLVAPRHLFRMPYSLHEKTSLASAVLTKEELENFSPKDANPLKIKIVDYRPKNEKDEAKKLLRDALVWKQGRKRDEEKYEKKYEGTYEAIEITGVKEEMFPQPIKKLLKGLKDGKKRGLFILITFLKSLNFPADYINAKIKDWNKLNEPPLKEGYVRGQIDWHLKQRKKILPPNYDNESFYKDLGLLDKKPEVKNPLVEVIRQLKRTK